MGDKEKKDEEDEGSMVEDLVDDILPGIGRLVKRLKNASPAFKSRIAETDREIKRKLEEGYSPKPTITYGYSVKPLVKEERVEPKERVKPEIEILEPLVDVFDEGDHLKLIAELPGVSEDDIKVEIGKRKIILDATSKERRYRKTIELTCDVKDIKKRYKNGLLELEGVKNGP